ncbi:hypothetical protein [Enterobacter bugandensis]|uniref:hypothetical protein n=1 Tax=Enterobacter bugandensis TaxID=881260 RepID=UPI002FD214A6
MVVFIGAIVLLLFILIVTLFELREPIKEIQRSSCIRSELLYDVETRTVTLGERYILTTFRYRSLNHTLFEYLYHNPGRKIERGELEKEVLRGRDVNLVKVADSMGFRCDLRRILFTADRDSITFHPEKLSNYNGVVKIS